MRELVKRVTKGWGKTDENALPKNGSTWYVVQFDYRYPREGAIVVTLTYYGNTANVIDQYYRMGWAFADQNRARELAKKINETLKPFYREF